MSKPRPDRVPEHSPSRLPPNLPQSTVREIASWLVGHTVESVERELILHTLAHCSGNRLWTASILGIPAGALEEKLRGYAEQGFAVPEPGDALAEDGEIEEADLEEDDGSADPAPPAESGQPGAEELPGQFQSGKRGGARWVAAIAAAAVAAGAIGFHMAGGSEAIAALFGADPAPVVAVSVPEKPVSPPQAAAPAKGEPEVKAASVEEAPKAAQVPVRTEPAAAAPAVMPVQAENPMQIEREPGEGAGGDATTITAAIEPEDPLELPQSAPLPVARPSLEQLVRPRAAPRAAQAKEAAEANPLRFLFPFGNRAGGPGAGPVCCDRAD